jgi:amphi-Trp domain-containing protein
MAPKDKIEFAGTVSAQEAAQYLESVARGLRERAMLLESGDVSMSLDVPDEVKIEIEASGDPEKGKASIEFSIGWKQRREEEAPVLPGLLIVAGPQAAQTPTFAE